MMLRSDETEAGIGLGSNLGDRAAALCAAVRELAATPGVRLLAQAPVYETDPVDVPGEFADKAYLNTVAVFAVSLPLEAWSARCHEVEDALGRVRTGYHHPRTIDVDLLYFGDAVRDEPHLHLPHPQIASRRFVCAPLADLRADLELPGLGRPVQDLLAALPEEPSARFFSAPGCGGAASALFLDRDDTIVPDAGYMGNPDQISLLPGAAEALRLARGAGLRLYLATNQSGIGRGYYSMADAEACNRRLSELVFGVPDGFDGVGIAPETPDAPSRYRKPSPAYLLERIAQDGLDPARCHVFGDKKSDLGCGLRVGIWSHLVFRGTTGAPRADAAAFAEAHGIPVHASLLEGVRSLLAANP